MSVSRETPQGLSARYRLGEAAAGQIERILESLAAEPDPHTSVSDPQAALEVHVADSLSGLEVSWLVRARRIADIFSFKRQEDADLLIEGLRKAGLPE